MIQHKSVLELGAGLGICGILAHKLDASVVVLTDGDTNTLQALRQNVALNTESNVPSSIIQCKQLRWGKHLDEFASSCISKYQVIIGSDVVYAQDQLEPLFDTVSNLLDTNGTFLLAFTRRNVSIDCVLDCATIYGFSWTEPDSPEGVFAFYRKML
jgi:predicted nicotinamide N-methyase